jgi:hypothetical protein
VATSPGHSLAARSVRGLARLLLATLPCAPVVAAAWPAVQDGVGIVTLCDARPSQLPDGRWSCRGAGGLIYTGALVEVTRPGTPPGVRPWDAPHGAPYRYVPYPWGPSREPTGYDALDPWLGGRGASDR